MERLQIDGDVYRIGRCVSLIYVPRGPRPRSASLDEVLVMALGKQDKSNGAERQSSEYVQKSSRG